MTINYKFTTDWTSPHVMSWKKHVISKLPLDEPTQWLEIGSWEGRSAIWVAENVLSSRSGSKITCVDNWHLSHIESNFDFNTQNISTIYKIKMNSQDFLCSELRTGRQECYDVIYIDGDHHARRILMDGLNAWPLLKKNGFMIFDDYFTHVDEIEEETQQPRNGIDEFLNLKKSDFEILYKEWQVIIKKF